MCRRCGIDLPQRPQIFWKAVEVHVGISSFGCVAMSLWYLKLTGFILRIRVCIPAAERIVVARHCFDPCVNGYQQA